MGKLEPKVPVDLEAVVVYLLRDWTPPQPDRAKAEIAARELTEMLSGPDPDPDDCWTADMLLDSWAEYAPADDDEARRWLASSILMDVGDVMGFPSARSWRRHPWTGKVASLLYVSGITSWGGSTSWSGIDPTMGDRRAVYSLPRWRSVLPTGRRRPYVLWMIDWKRACLKTQVQLFFRGEVANWHRPGPNIGSFCGTCMPCPECGEADEHSCSAFGSP